MTSMKTIIHTRKKTIIHVISISSTTENFQVLSQRYSGVISRYDMLLHTYNIDV